MNTVALLISMAAFALSVYLYAQFAHERTGREEEWQRATEHFLEELEESNMAFVRELETIKQDWREAYEQLAEEVGRLQQESAALSLRAGKEPAEYHPEMPPPFANESGRRQSVPYAPESPIAGQSSVPKSSPASLQQLMEQVKALKKVGKSNQEIAQFLHRGVGEIELIQQLSASLFRETKS